MFSVGFRRRQESDWGAPHPAIRSRGIILGISSLGASIQSELFKAISKRIAREVQ